MSPYRIDLHDPSDSLSRSLRPRWPYTLGAIAGPMLGLCVLSILALAALRTHGASGETAAFFALIGIALAALLLGIAWAGALRAGHGGAGPIAGSLAFPLAVTCAILHRADNDEITVGALFAGALAAFAWGHVAAPCGAVVRGLAAVTATLWSFLFAAVVKRWTVPTEIVLLSLIALALTGIGLGSSFLRLRHAAPRDAG